MSKWISRWNTWTAAKPSLPGVWRRKEGGFLVRGRAQDPRTGQRKEVKFVVTDTDEPATAFERLQASLREIRDGRLAAEARPPQFGEFAQSLFDEKKNDGSISSPATKVKWKSVLDKHLVPAFGTTFVDQLRRGDVMAWRAAVAKQVHAGEYSPHTANDWLAILRVIMTEAVERFDLDRDPMRKVEDFDTRLHRTYTREQPNALTVDEVPQFLAAVGRLYPEYLALVALGFATGLRPSSLRPLRRQGPRADVLWDSNQLLVRRSHTEGRTAIDMVKTARDQTILLPDEMMETLRWHVARLAEGPMGDSELLFPAADGGLLDRGCLRGPFAAAAKEIGLKKDLTPRGMRRTFQDLARAAQLHDLVTRAVSGHATATMQQHYSTVSSLEVQSGLAKVISLAQVKQALAAAQSADDLGVHLGVHGPKRKKAG